MRLRIIRPIRLWAREAQPTLALALPIMAGMVGQMLMGLADTIMVGRVGVVPLAAAAFVSAVAHLPLGFVVHRVRLPDPRLPGFESIFIPGQPVAAGAGR